MKGRAWAAVVFGLLLGCAVAAPCQEPRIFVGPGAWEHPSSSRTTERDLLFNDRFPRGFQSRSFYFTAYLDDGLHLEISVFHWEYGLLGGWGLQVVTAGRGDEAFVFEERIPDREISVGRERFFVRFGANLLEGAEGRYSVSLRLEGFDCDLEFTALVPPWLPGDGYAALGREGEAYIRYGVAAPLAAVTGTLSVSGRTRSVQGWGYADRGLIAAPINRMSSPTYSFRAFGRGSPGTSGLIVSLLRYESHPHYGPTVVPVLLCIEGEQWLIAAREFSFAAGDWAEEPQLPVAYPRRLAVRAGGILPGEPGGGFVLLEGAFVGTALYHYADVFEKIPGVFRALVDVFFDRPIIFRMLGSFEGTITFSDGSRSELSLPGHAEYTVVE